MLTLRPYQREPVRKAIAFFREEAPDPALIVMPTGCHAKGTPIPLYDGTVKPVEEIKVGDELIGSDGLPVTVTELHSGTEQMYDIIPNNGEPFTVNGSHILHLYKVRKGYKHPSEEPGYDQITVEEYTRTSKNYKHLHKLHRIDKIVHPTREVPIDPYFLGLYLGDGCSAHSTPSITTMHGKVAESIAEFAAMNQLKIRISEKKGNKAKDFFIKNKKNEKNILTEKLRELKLYGLLSQDKFIPEQYILNDERTRLELLAGLLDTNGYYETASNRFEYSTKSERLKNGITFLCRSLGICAKSSTRTINGQVYHVIKIVGRIAQIPTRVKGTDKRDSAVQKTVTGFKAVRAGVGQYYGFTVTGDHLYCDNQLFVHHNSGKSILAAEVAAACPDPILVVQPTKELLEQNLSKYRALCGDLAPAGVYSASFGKKNIEHVTFATIGSVKALGGTFRDLGFRKMLIDEAHLYPARETSMLGQFLRDSGIRHVLGITATPVRLNSYRTKFKGKYCNWSQLDLLTEPTPDGVFYKDILHVGQISELVSQSYWSPLRYEAIPFDRQALRLNTTGAEYTQDSIEEAYKLNNIRANIYAALDYHSERRHCLVFVPSVEEAAILAEGYPEAAWVSGETPKKQRDAAIRDFREGRIRVLFNCSVLAVGFDYTGIDMIVLAMSTASVGRYYQIVGRGVRIDPGKQDCVIVDMGGNAERFGDVRKIEWRREAGHWTMTGEGDTILSGLPVNAIGLVDTRDLREICENPYLPDRLSFGKHKDMPADFVPVNYLSFILSVNTRMSETNRLVAIRALCTRIRDTRGEPPLTVFPDGKYVGRRFSEATPQYIAAYTKKEWNVTNDSLRRGLELFTGRKLG